MIEKCAKNEGSDNDVKTLSSYAASNKNYFIFFVFLCWGVAFLIEK